MRIRGVYLIRRRTYQMGRRRLSKMVMGGVHLNLYFLEAYICNEMEAYI